MTSRARLLLVLSLVSATARAQVPLSLTGRGSHQVEVTQPGPRTWELHAQGSNPYVVTEPAPVPYDLAATSIFTFEYRAAAPLDGVGVGAGPPWSPFARASAPTLGASADWSTFAVDVASIPGIAATKPTAWRLDLGSQSAALELRNPMLRPRNPDEQLAAIGAALKTVAFRDAETALRRYLAQSHPARVERVVVADDTLTVHGKSKSRGEVLLAEWPVWQPVAPTMHFASTWPLSGPSFSVTVPRFDQDGRDRSLSRFVVVRRHGTDSDELLSYGHWADVPPAAPGQPEWVPHTKKGLGGFYADPLQVRDLDDLGVGSVTVNIPLNWLFQDKVGNGAEPVTAGGHTWFANAAALKELDSTLLIAAARKVVVLAIILVPPARSWSASALGALLQHPEYDPAGVYTMPNLTTAESTAAYVMALDLLAKRYGRSDGRYGRIHRWIMHNEVDAGWDWTNCGRLPELLVLDQYYRSMRLADLIVRRQDPAAEVMISLTHDWTEVKPPSFAPRDLLDDLLTLSRAEGDFPWGVAFHPYPENLTNPRTWLDSGAEFTFDTPHITFRNIEVLDAWMRRSTSLFQGRTVRDLYLSEQGPNSPDYGEPALQRQAAALAYVWKKIARLDSIRGFDYHNWRDNPGEGGLRIGLRRFAGDPHDPSGAKPIWYLYRALGTKDEDTASAFALPIIGLTDWSAALHSDPIPDPRRKH